VSRYRDLGPTLMLAATPDNTGKNPGNWTLVANSQSLNCYVALAEVYQITINGPVGSTFSLWRGNRLWNNVVQGWSNTYDPTNPLYLRPSDELFFYWRAPTSRLPTPSAVIWLRFDLDLPENRPYTGDVP
jgi:hypothetical protein